MPMLQKEITQGCVNDKKLTESTDSHCRLSNTWIEEAKTSQSRYHCAQFIPPKIHIKGCANDTSLHLTAQMRDSSKPEAICIDFHPLYLE